MVTSVMQARVQVSARLRMSSSNASLPLALLSLGTCGICLLRTPLLLLVPLLLRIFDVLGCPPFCNGLMVCSPASFALCHTQNTPLHAWGSEDQPVHGTASKDV